MTGMIMPLRERDTSTIQALAGAFLFSLRYVDRDTRCGYAGNPGH
jgi:predicted DNA-binding transcriptional regulator YafY